MKKIIILSSVLFSILLLSGCEQQLSQNPSPLKEQPASVITQEKSNDKPLQTYSNAKWGFEIKYPSEYEAKIDSENSAGLGFSIRKLNNQEEAKNSDGACSNCIFKLAMLPNFIGGTDKGSFKNPEDWLNDQKRIGQNYTQTTVANTYTAYMLENQGRKNYLIFHQNVNKGVIMFDRYDLSIKKDDKNGEIILSSFNLIPKLSTEEAITVDVNILPKDDYAVTPENMPNGPSYPKSVIVSNPKNFSDQIAAYGGADKVWIGPKRWNGEAETGADGSVRVDLYPSNGSVKSGPHITYYEIPGCIGCMLSEAALYFPNAAQNYKTNFDPTPIKIPQGLKVVILSPTLLTYTLPDHNGFSSKGVAFYQAQSEGTDPYYIEATFVLPKSEENLSKFLQQTFIDQEKLK